jgi:hypothetical protein
MLRKAIFSLAIFLLCDLSFAKYVAVLETAADPAAKDKVSISERQYLTNILREKAVKTLPAELNFTIMTRENINVMLPPGKSIEDCEGSCLAETGKNIAADYVAQARIGKLGENLTISAELYETAGNKLLASFNGRSASIEGLVVEINNKATDFFKKARGNDSWGMSGFGDFSGAGGFSMNAKQKYIVDVESEPAGATLSIDGRPEPKCTSTPCRILVETGEHLFLAAREGYDVSEMVVNVNENGQKIKMTLTSIYGSLVIKPKRLDNAGVASDMRIELDGKQVASEKFQLEPGIHEVQITHPCCDPVFFKVSIMKGKEERFEEPLVRALGGISLTADSAGVPVAIPVYFDRVLKGTTPFASEVPLCTKVTVGDKFNQDEIPVSLKFHETVEYNYHVRGTPEDTVKAPVKTAFEKGYDELECATGGDCKPAPSDKPVIGESVPANVKPEKKIHWIPLGISAAVFAAGTIIAVVENSSAKKTYEKKPQTKDEYGAGLNDVRSAQTGRAVGVGLAIVGALGVGLSFVF